MQTWRKSIHPLQIQAWTPPQYQPISSTHSVVLSIALLLIVTHDLVIGLVSKGSAIAFGALGYTYFVKLS